MQQEVTRVAEMEEADLPTDEIGEKMIILAELSGNDLNRRIPKDKRLREIFLSTLRHEFLNDCRLSVIQLAQLIHLHGQKPNGPARARRRLLEHFSELEVSEKPAVLS